MKKPPALTQPVVKVIRKNLPSKQSAETPIVQPDKEPNENPRIDSLIQSLNQDDEVIRQQQIQLSKVKPTFHYDSDVSEVDGESATRELSTEINQ